MRLKQDNVIQRLHSFTKNIIQRRRIQLIEELESIEQTGSLGNKLDTISSFSATITTLKFEFHELPIHRRT